VEKKSLLKNEGFFIESEMEGRSIINVYFLNGFFVEVTVCEGEVIYNLPYQRGHMISESLLHQIEKRNTAYSLAA
jgi:hypothetical protein